MSIFDFSFLGIHIAPTWYGLMYAIGFIACYEYIKKNGYISTKDTDSLLLFVFLGVILGGRIGYVILYDFSYFLEHPMEIFATWNGGMSFHGGAIGVIIAIFLFAWKKKYNVFDVSDPIVTILPLALGLGRIGNYINQELLGFFPYSGPLAIEKNGISYFPSTLLEASLEGGLLLIVMLVWKYFETKTGRKRGYASALFLGGYGIFRLFAELFRLPDVQIGYLFSTDWITLGMMYTIPMMLGSLVVFFFARNLQR
ncbi:MAG: prolipoprotein diacylglyceryl transferase [Candidatus Gracilibacteria bacterium]|nr:prolipoprotein diacylglyceryl transferase [Candidatus Gracilibacteria bacterium]